MMMFINVDQKKWPLYGSRASHERRKPCKTRSVLPTCKDAVTLPVSLFAPHGFYFPAPTAESWSLRLNKNALHGKNE